MTVRALLSLSTLCGLLALLLLSSAAILCSAQRTFVRTIAGNAAPVTNVNFASISGDGVLATQNIGRPSSIALDSEGLLYFTETNRIRKIKADGTLLTVVNTERSCYLDGDGGPAAAAGACIPSSIVFDSQGNMHISDTGNNRIRTMTSQGIMSTVVGTSVKGYNLISGDGGPATSATLGSPDNVVLDNLGNLLFAERGSNRIRKIDRLTGIISLYIGSATSAAYAGASVSLSSSTPPSLNGVSGLFFDTIANALYFSEDIQSVIRRVKDGVMTTIAGDGSGYGGFNGDNLQATSTKLNFPKAVWMSIDGVLYIADSSNYRLRALYTNGIISTVAGSGALSDGVTYSDQPTSVHFGYINYITGDGPSNKVYLSDNSYVKVYVYDIAQNNIAVLFGSTYAGFEQSSILRPYGLCVVNSTKLFFADYGGNKIRYFDLMEGTITDVAGNGQFFLKGDGGPATKASFYNPQSLWVSSSGAMFITDTFNGRIRLLDLKTGNISTYAGSRTVGLFGYNGDNLLGTNTLIRSPTALLVDTSGTIYFSEVGNYIVRKLRNNIVTTIVGNGTNLFLGDNQPARASSSPVYGMAIDTQGNLYLSMQVINMVCLYNRSTERVTIFAGNGLGQLGGDGGPANTAYLYNPRGLWLDSTGNLFIADSLNGRIRKVNTITKTIETILGYGSTGKPSSNRIATGNYANKTGLTSLGNMVGDNQGTLYFIDKAFSSVYKVASNGIVQLHFGNSSISYVASAFAAGVPRSSAVLPNPSAIAYRKSTNEILLASDYLHIVISVAPITFTLAGGGNSLNDGGNAAEAMLNTPTSLWIESSDTTLFIADSGQYRIRKVNLTTNIITTFAGNGMSADGGNAVVATSASIGTVGHICGDAARNLYLSDRTYSKLRKINANGIMYTIVGTGTTNYNGDNIAASSASLNGNNGVWVDSIGNIFIADSSNQRIRKVTSVGIITTFAGNGQSALTDQNMEATSSTLGTPTAIWGDSNGNLYVVESLHYRIRKIDKFGWMTNFVGVGAVGLTGPPAENVLATSSLARRTHHIVGDTLSNIYFVDFSNSRIRKIFEAAAPTSQPSRQPTAQPIIVPTSAPTRQPIRSPTSQPSISPTMQPSVRPSSQPSCYPSKQPTAVPTSQPFLVPTCRPTQQPISHPSTQPSQQPSSQPSKQPMAKPSAQPSRQPSNQPSQRPTSHPSTKPSQQPSSRPSTHPVSKPSAQPSRQPSNQPSQRPISHPSTQPSKQPSGRPSCQPTVVPTASPTSIPSFQPKSFPTNQPTVYPTKLPSSTPSAQPVSNPTMPPIAHPSVQPIGMPSSRPTLQPIGSPTSYPSKKPVGEPTSIPSMQPTQVPTARPSKQPTGVPSAIPSITPTRAPKANPSVQPYGAPTAMPSVQPMGAPSKCPTTIPTSAPSSQPRSKPSIIPSTKPSNQPSSQPSINPSSYPSNTPTSVPSAEPFSATTIHPTKAPRSWPTSTPSDNPSKNPTVYPSSSPTTKPSHSPISTPTQNPASHPTCEPSSKPSTSLLHTSTLNPTFTVSQQPTSLPSNTLTILTELPSAKPSIHTPMPTLTPSLLPSVESAHPSMHPTRDPSFMPSCSPSFAPQNTPSTNPSGEPTDSPTVFKSSISPSKTPSLFPSIEPTTHPTNFPSQTPTVMPTINPSRAPALQTRAPTASPTRILSEHPTVFPIVLTFTPSSSFSISIKNATFTENGDMAEVILSTETDRFGYFLEQVFNCSEVLAISCSTMLSCNWASSKSIKIDFRNTNCMEVNSVVRLSASALQAKMCLSDVNTCRSTIETNNTVPIVAPFQVSKPVIRLNIPTTIGSCSSLLLDATASTGNLAKDWTSFKWTVFSTNATSSKAIQRYLDSNTQTQSPTAIPNQLLISGIKYSFELTICTLFSSCATATHQVTVANTLLPAVYIINSAANGTLTPASTLSLSAIANVPSCSGGFSKSTLISYAWKILSSRPMMAMNVKSSSKDPSKFVVPPFSLEAAMYRVEVVVSISSAQFVSVSTSVMIGPGRLVPVIQGSLKKQVGVESTIAIDGSKSYDENVLSSLGTSSIIDFSWTCALVDSMSPCNIVFDSNQFQATMRTSILRLVVLKEAPVNQVARLTMLIVDPTKARNASIDVLVEILPVLSPVITITSSSAEVQRLNADTRLQLLATVKIPGGLWGNLSWNTPKNLLFDATSKLFTATTSPQILSHFLSIPPNVLKPGGKYLFTLIAFVASPGRSSLVSINFETNTPPSLGSFFVSPKHGIAIKDYFSFACSKWQDKDMPLLYQFGYVGVSSQGSNILVSLRSPSEASIAAAQLPSGNLSTFANIYDSLFAVTRIDDKVFVEKETDSEAEIASYIFASLTAAKSFNNADVIRQNTALANYLLNRLDCSLAPNCFALNRFPCSSVSHTCGACLSDAYVGLDGAHNEFCFPPGTTPTTSITNKTCTSNCFGNGECEFVSLKAAKKLSECLVGDLTCTAACTCAPSFRGTNCEFTTAEHESKISMREVVIESLLSLPSLEDVSSISVETLVSAMNQATQKLDELSPKSSRMALNFTQQILQSLKPSKDEPTKSLLTLFQTISYIFEKDVIAAKLAAVDGSRRQLAIDTVGDVDLQAWSLLESLNQYGILVANAKLVGQPSVTALDARFKVFSASIDPFAVHSNVTSIKLPNTKTEEALDTDETRIELPLSIDSNTPPKLTVTSLSSGLFVDEDLMSNVLSTQSTSPMCNDCPVRFTIPHRANMNAGNEKESFTLTCLYGKKEQLTYNCAAGEVFKTTCNGTKEVITGTCPTTRLESNCAMTSEFSFQSVHDCRVVSETVTNITCECKHPPQSRRLQSNTNETSTIYVANYLVLAKTVYRSFVTTTSSAKKLNVETTKEGKEVIATLGSLIVCIALALALSMYADTVEEDEHRKVAPDGTFRTRKTFDNNSLMSKTFTRISLLNVKFSKLFAPQVAPLSQVTKNRLSMALGNLITNRNSPKSLLQIAEEALPSVLSSKSLWFRFLAELKRHHRWFGVLFYYSQKFPRIYRVISLATNVVIMLFMQSITYNLTKGDDGSCATFHTQDTCLAQASAYRTSESMCRWDATEESCIYIPPDDDLQVIVFVAVFSALVSTPIALIADWVIQHVLAAPTITLGSKKPDVKTIALQQDQQVHDDLRKSIAIVVQTERELRRKRNLTMTHKSNDKLHALQNTQQAFRKLQLQVKEYRHHIDDVKQKEEFDEIWGLDEEGNFLRTRLRFGNNSEALEEDQEVSTVSSASFLFKQALTCLRLDTESYPVADLIAMELHKLQSDFVEEQQRFSTEMLSEKDKSKRLLFLFQKDLLPGISGQILEAKDRRDHIVIHGKSTSAKWLGALFLFLLNGFMLFYIFLFASVQDNHRQKAWARSFAIWLVMEIFIVSSLLVLVMHVLIPSMIMKDISKVRRHLVESVELYQANIAANARSRMITEGEKKVDPKRNGDEGNDSSGSSSSDEGEGDQVKPSSDVQGSEVKPAHDHHYHGFNAAKMLFLSYKVASLYPELRVSKVIQAFETPWPKQSYHRASDVAKKYSRKFATLSRSASIIVMFFITSFLSGPSNIQDLALSITTTLVIGYIILLHLQLYEVYPALIIVPALVIAVILHFFYVSNKPTSTSSLSTARQNRQTVQVADMAKDICSHMEANQTRMQTEIPHKMRRDSLLEGIQVAKKAHEVILDAHPEEQDESGGSRPQSRGSTPRDSVDEDEISVCSDDSESSYMSSLSFMSLSSTSSIKLCSSAASQSITKAAKIEPAEVIFEDLQEDARSRCQSFQPLEHQN